ncbi:hypothetical protein pb186bvf_015158 [Paramecium bursaria]
MSLPSVLRFCYLCYFCCMTFIMLIITFAFTAYLTETFSDYNVVVDNWKSDVMLQLRVSQNVCDKNEQQLNLYTWPGSRSACDCRDINYVAIVYYFLDHYVPERKLYIGHTCNSTDHFYGCYSIPGTWSKNLKYFSDQDGNKFTLCAQLSKGDNFYLPPADCQEGKLCGTSKENQFCSKSDVCPIYDFGFGDPPKEAIEQQNGFWISRQSEEHLPIVNIIAGEGEGMCANPQLLPITKGREDFILMSLSKVDCLRDDRFIKILSTPETKFYEVNDMILTIKRLIIMEIDDKYQWNLYKRPYIPWKSKCRDQELQQFVSQGSKQASIQTIWGFVILIIIIAILFSTCSMCFGDQIFKHDWIMYDKNDEKNQIYLFKIENITKFAVYLIIIGLINITSMQVSDIQDLILLYNAKECSDKFTNFLLQQQIQKLEPYSNKQSAFVVFLVLLIIVDVTLLIIFLINLMQNRDDNQYQQLNQHDNIPVNQPDNSQNLNQDQEHGMNQTDMEILWLLYNLIISISHCLIILESANSYFNLEQFFWH